MNTPACRSYDREHSREQAVIHVYLDDGTKFKYECPVAQGREHASAIVRSGYRSVRDGTLTHYPPHRILKVKAVGGQTTEYTDTVSGT